MKILVENNEGVFNTLNQAGYNPIRWDIRKSTFDIFDENDPEVYIGTTRSITKSLVKCIKNHNTKTALRFNGSENLHMLNKDINVFGNIKNIRLPTSDVNVANILPAADTTILNSFQLNYQSDVSYVGNFDIEVFQYIFPLCNTDMKTRIFGYSVWPVPQYLGIVDNRYMESIYKNSKVCPNVNGLSDRFFQILVSDGICVTNETINEIELPTFNSSDELLKLCQDIIKSKGKNKSFKSIVLDGHTYWHRLIDIFDFLNLKEHSDNIREKYNEFVRF